LEAQISTEPKNQIQPGTEVKLSATIKNVGTAAPNAPAAIQIRIDPTIDSSGSHNASSRLATLPERPAMGPSALKGLQRQLFSLRLTPNSCTTTVSAARTRRESWRKAVKDVSYRRSKQMPAGAGVAVKILMETDKNTPSIVKGICSQT
jgi:hypothetical protein